MAAAPALGRAADAVAPLVPAGGTPPGRVPPPQHVLLHSGDRHQVSGDECGRDCGELRA